MLADKLRSASLTRTPFFVGAVTKTAANGLSWDTPAEALDVMSLAEVGDLVVISFAFDNLSDNTFTWNGMTFTSTQNNTGSSNRRGYVGYRFVQAGDTNPYVTNVGSNWSGLSITASIFRNVGPFVTSATFSGATGNTTLPSLARIDATGSVRIYCGVVDGATVSDWGAPPNYTLATSVSYSVSTTKSTTATCFRIQNLATDSPTPFTGTMDVASDGWFSSGLLFE